MNRRAWIEALGWWWIAASAFAGDASAPIPSAPAATPLVQRITLDDALMRARASSARVGALAALHGAAEAGLAAAQAAHWPELDVTVGYTHQSSVPELSFALPGQAPQTIFPNIQDNYRARAGVGLPLYTGGHLTAAEEAARSESAATAQDVRAGIHDVTLETIAAFWSLVAARETTVVLDRALAAFDRHLADAQAALAVGTAARSDVLAVEVERDRATLARLDAENRSRVTNSDLARLVGSPAAIRFEPETPSALPAAPAVDVEVLVKQAYDTRPEHLALTRRVEAARARVRAEEGAYFPQASFSAGYDEARPNRRILPQRDTWDSSWDVGVNVSLSVFDFGRTRAAVSRAQAQADAASRQLEDLEARLRQEVSSRLSDLETALGAVPVAERALASATENERVSADRYREGVAPSSERLDAEVALVRAGLDRTRAIATAHLARASLDRVLGWGVESP